MGSHLKEKTVVTNVSYKFTFDEKNNIEQYINETTHIFDILKF